MTYQMDDETFRALRVILDDHSSEDPAGGVGSGVADLERLNRAYETVGEWCRKQTGD
jgi:hypothetical protein